MTTNGRWIGRVLVIAAALGGIEATRAADEGAADPALKALQGTWTSGDPSGVGTGTWTFEGSTLRVELPAMAYVAKVAVDGPGEPTKLDITITEGQAEAVGETVQGIIQVQGDRAILCVSIPGAGRPTTFEPGDGVFRFTLTRKPG